MENYLRFCWVAGVVKNLRNLEYEIPKLPNLSKFSNLSTIKPMAKSIKGEMYSPFIYLLTSSIARSTVLSIG